MPKRFSYDNTGFVRAQARWVRSSPQKARVVLAHIRGKNVLEARALLLYSKRAVAKDIELVLRSAVANAEANHGLSPDELMVHEAFADDGVTIKRWRPRARGRANRIEKRTTHITLLLRPIDGVEFAGPPEPEPEPVVEEKPKRRRGSKAAAAAAEAAAPVSTDEPAEGATEPGEGQDVGPASTDEPVEGSVEVAEEALAEAEAVVVDDEVEAPEDVAEDDEAVADSEPAADEQDDDDEPSAQADGKE